MDSSTWRKIAKLLSDTLWKNKAEVQLIHLVFLHVSSAMKFGTESNFSITTDLATCPLPLPGHQVCVDEVLFVF